MTVIGAVVSRNLRIFFRDRLNVFFSLLSGIILFLLYTLFLGRLQRQGLQAQFPAATDAEIGAFVDSWMFAGIVLLTTVSSGLGALSSLVEDRQSKRFLDFLVSPVRRVQLVLGYLLAAVIVAVLVSFVILAISILYLGLVDGLWLAPEQILASAGILLLSCVAFTALSAFVVSFVRTSGAFSALATIVGTAMGFVAGAYIPVGQLPDAVADGINALPFGQAAMLLRVQFTDQSLPALTAGQPDAAAEAIRTSYGIDISVGDLAVAPWFAIAVLAAVAVVFTGLAATRIRSLIR
jgi:multidrug/hemolysin transport system permease protein